MSSVSATDDPVAALELEYDTAGVAPQSDADVEMRPGGSGCGLIAAISMAALLKEIGFILIGLRF
jgi:hypothetical protein